MTAHSFPRSVTTAALDQSGQVAGAGTIQRSRPLSIFGLRFEPRTPHQAVTCTYAGADGSLCEPRNEPGSHFWNGKTLRPLRGRSDSQPVSHA